METFAICCTQLANSHDKFEHNYQEYFMDLYLLAELKTISLKITTVDMKRPPPDFRSNFEAAQPPILIDGGEKFLF